jgi:hypothetical protein
VANLSGLIRTNPVPKAIRRYTRVQLRAAPCPPRASRSGSPKTIRFRDLRDPTRIVFDKRVKMVFFVARWDMKTTMTTKQGMLPGSSRGVGIWQHRCAFGIVGGTF